MCPLPPHNREKGWLRRHWESLQNHFTPPNPENRALPIRRQLIPPRRDQNSVGKRERKVNQPQTERHAWVSRWYGARSTPTTYMYGGRVLSDSAFWGSSAVVSGNGLAVGCVCVRTDLVEDPECFSNFLLAVCVLHFPCHHGQKLREINGAIAWREIERHQSGNLSPKENFSRVLSSAFTRVIHLSRSLIPSAARQQGNEETGGQMNYTRSDRTKLPISASLLERLWYQMAKEHTVSVHLVNHVLQLRFRWILTWSRTTISRLTGVAQWKLSATVGATNTYPTIAWLCPTLWLWSFHRHPCRIRKRLPWTLQRSQSDMA